MLTLKNITKIGSNLLTRAIIKPSPLIHVPIYNFAFMQLFERTKTPAELDPIFKRQTKMKGHIKSKAIKEYSPKLNTKARAQKQRLKNHEGLLKRVKIVIFVVNLGGTQMEQTVQVPVARQKAFESS